MIDLICSKCQTKLPVAESKIGTRIFVCPKCAQPLEAPGTLTPNPSPAGRGEPKPPAAVEASEDKTMAPDASQAYVQEKLRQIAEKRASKPSLSSELPTAPMPLARPVPSVKKSGLPIALLAVGGVGVAGVAAVISLVAFFILGRDSTPDNPARDGIARDGVEKKEEKPVEVKHVDLKTFSVDALAKAVKEGPADMRKKALAELKERGPEARPALAAVLDLLKDKDVPMRTSAQETLVRMGPPNKADLPIYAAALREQAAEPRVYAAGQLAELGQQAKSELLFLRILSLDDNAEVQEAAKKAVQRIEEDLLGTLLKGLQDKSAAVRSKSAAELAEMGPGAKAALPNLVEALADKNPAVRLAVLEVFLAIGPDAVMVLGESLRDKNVEVRLTAIDALSKMGSDARFVMPELIIAITSGDARTKEAALKAFARIGDFAIPYLIEALEREKNAAKQKPLVEALERMGPTAGPALAMALKKATPEVKKVAAEVVVKVAEQPKPAPIRTHNGPAGAIQAELRGWFNATDLNKDGFLDKEELAKAIRGPKSKAYDFTLDGKPARAFGPKDFAKYPDFAFLCRLDRDNDSKISREEYEYWAFDQAEVMQKDKDEKAKIAQAQARLAERNLSDAMRLQTEANIRNMWAAYRNQNALMWRANHDLNQMQWMQRWVMDRLPNYRPNVSVVPKK